jgi:aerobic-type carbon monoxide dehydrogenase small subunit (CoxS/CutS family)
MPEFKLTINNKTYTVNADPKMPLLWLLRDTLGLTGTKFGCGIAQCGACTVHVDGLAVRSCSTTISVIGERKITTIEGLSQRGDHPVQLAWIEKSVPQCGYCQAGQVMAAAALLNKNRNPSKSEIDIAMSGNICRCGTYIRMRQAIERAAALMNEGSSN